MASTDVDICNGALLELGEEVIVALSDNNKRARACNQRYADIRDSILRSHLWNFAVKRETLIDQTIISNGKFTSGIQSWTDSSDASSNIAWYATDKNLKLSAVYSGGAKSAIASQAFTLSSTTTVKLTATLKSTDAATAATDNYIGIGTTATNVDQIQTYFSSLNDNTEATAEVTLSSGTYYVTLGTYNSVSGTYVSYMDDISLNDVSEINKNYKYANKFALPSDMLRILDTSMDTTYGLDNFSIEGDYLTVDSDEISIRYIAQVTDVTKYDTLFIEAFMAKLGAALATHLVDSDSRRQQQEALFKMKMREARFIDSQEGTPERMPDGSWLGSRYGIMAK